MKVFKVYSPDGQFDASYTNSDAAQAHIDYVARKYNQHGFYMKVGFSKSSSIKRKRKVSTGSKSRVSSKSKRKNLYDWAWKQKGKGSLTRIGKKMKSLKKTGGLGAKVATRQLGRIGDLKSAFNAGRNSVRRYKKR